MGGGIKEHVFGTIKISSPPLIAARVGVPSTVLAFSALYWGYGLSKYMED